jgi:hypothetical protein
MKAVYLFVAVVSLWLAGCASQNSPAAKAAVAPPAPVQPHPLSTPQTHVELPEAQPVDPAALVTEPPKEAATPAVSPTPTPTRTTPTRRTIAPPPVVPVTPPPATVQLPADPPRPAIQEIVSPVEAKRLQDSAQARRSEASKMLQQIARRRLNRSEQDVAASIRNFLALSEDAEKRGDMRQADALAERAQILAKELQSGQ